MEGLTKLTYRYPGVKPFEESEKELFFGRDSDISALFDMIHSENLVVLFGKSGYGKSSLLNAGLIPYLNERIDSSLEYIPIVIRFGSYTKESDNFFRSSVGLRDQSPMGILMKKLEERIPDCKELTPFVNVTGPLLNEKTVWLLLKNHIYQHGFQKFLFIFDQFEEFFSYPLQEQNLFKSILEELFYTKVPKVIKEQSGSLDREIRKFISDPLDIKCLFAIRSDKMSLMDTMKDYLPGILRHRYQLKGLSGEQAKLAIKEPAQLTNTNFESSKFTYSDDALQKILNNLKVKDLAEYENNGFEVEAFQLQIICQYIEHKVKNNLILTTDEYKNCLVQPEDLPDMSGLYEAYYHRNLSVLPENLKAKAQLILEEGLLTEDIVTGEPYRLSIDSRTLIRQFHLEGEEKELLIALSNTFLIRPEQNSVGGVSYEISHDTLIGPIQRAKNKRREDEKIVLAKQTQKATEEKLLNEQEKRKEAERLRRKSERFAVGAIICAIMALLAMLYAVKSKKDALESSSKYIQELELRIKIELVNEKIKAEKDINQAHNQLQGGGSCISDSLFSRISQAALLFKDVDFKQKVDSLNQAIIKKAPNCRPIRY